MSGRQPSSEWLDQHENESSLPASIIVPRRRASLFRWIAQRVREWGGSWLEGLTLPEDERPADPLSYLVATTPPWLVSLIVHFSLMIVMGLLALEAHRATQESSAIEVELSKAGDDEQIWAERLGEQLDDPSVLQSSEGLDGLAGEVVAFAASDLPLVDDPLVAPPMLDLSPTGTFAGGTEAAPAIGLEFSGREVGLKKALLKAYGGTALTEEAVEEGLKWLARAQQRHGMWSLVGPYSDGGNAENEEAATAMALLAYQGAGYTPHSSEDRGFRRVVTRGWQGLLRREQDDGRFYGEVASGHKLYTQALCTIALCELLGMTRDESYRDAAQRAVDYCVKIQTEEGGWRYEPGVASDMSVTGWFVMALQSARMAGIEVPSSTFERIEKFLDSVARDSGSKYAYLPRDGATVPLTAEGLLCRQYLGWERDDPRLRDGVDFLLANLPQWDKRNIYYWYYGTQVCHHMEGADWQKWNGIMRQLLPEHQERRGPERGSWDPTSDRWGSAGGRLYVTCLSLYALEVYYRHLPLYSNGLLAR